MEDQNINFESSAYRSFPFFRILYRNLTLIIAIIVIAGVLGALYGFLTVKPVYTAKCDAIFNVRLDNSEQIMSGNNSSFAKKALPTFSDFITSPAVENAARQQSKDYGISRGAVSVTYGNDSLKISISYTAGTADLAEKRLDAYIEAADAQFKEKTPYPEVKSIALVKLQNNYRITQSSGASNYVLIGIVGGVVLGVAIAVLRYLLDNKMKDKAEIEEITGVSLLSYIDKQ